VRARVRVACTEEGERGGGAHERGGAWQGRVRARARARVRVACAEDGERGGGAHERGGARLRREDELEQWCEEPQVGPG
jgi:hypothetical protein